MKSVAFVTGSSRGIGRAVALELAGKGYAVAVNGRTASEDLRSLTAQINAMGGQAESFVCDVSDPDAVAAAVDAITARMGDIEVLVNNAGISQQKLFTDLTAEEWRRMMAVHADGTFYTCRAVLPGMIHRHSGVIVNVSSMWGQTGGSCEVHYSAAKAAVIGMTKALAKEVGPSGIRVNCVAPGVIMTDMMKEFDGDTLRDLTEETPLCRLGTPEDVAHAVAFLVSGDAAFITGQVLSPNGGILI